MNNASFIKGFILAFALSMGIAVGFVWMTKPESPDACYSAIDNSDQILEDFMQFVSITADAFTNYEDEGFVSLAIADQKIKRMYDTTLQNVEAYRTNSKACRGD